MEDPRPQRSTGRWRTAGPPAEPEARAPAPAARQPRGPPRRPVPGRPPRHRPPRAPSLDQEHPARALLTAGAGLGAFAAERRNRSPPTRPAAGSVTPVLAKESEHARSPSIDNQRARPQRRASPPHPPMPAAGAMNRAPTTRRTTRRTGEHPRVPRLPRPTLAPAHSGPPRTLPCPLCAFAALRDPLRSSPEGLHVHRSPSAPDARIPAQSRQDAKAPLRRGAPPPKGSTSTAPPPPRTLEFPRKAAKTPRRPSAGGASPSTAPPRPLHQNPPARAHLGAPLTPAGSCPPPPRPAPRPARRRAGPTGRRCCPASGATASGCRGPPAPGPARTRP